MNPVVTFSILVVSFAFAGSLILVPRWFGVSMLRHRLWDLHDGLRHRARHADEEAFDLMADDVLRTIRIAHLLTPLRAVMVLMAGKPDLPPDRLDAALRDSLLVASPSQRKVLHASLRELDQMRLRFFMFTSWSGLILTSTLWLPLLCMKAVLKLTTRTQSEASVNRAAALPPPPEGMQLREPAPLEERADLIENQIYVVFPNMASRPAYGARGFRPLLR